MTVLQVIDSRDGFYGAEKMVLSLSAGLRRHGFRPVVAAFRHAPDDRSLEILDAAASQGLTTEVLDCQGRWDYATIIQLRKMFDKHEVSIVHSHNVKANLYSRIAACSRPIKTVGTCHSWYGKTKKDWLVSAVDRLTLRSFHHVVVVSDKLRASVARFGVAAEKTTVIDNGVFHTPSPANVPPLSAELGLDGKRLIGSVGRLSTEKGHRFLLEALPGVLARVPDCALVLAGDGPERSALASLARDLGIAEQVHFLGVRRDISNVLSSLEIFVLPSLAEGSPLALIEAMMAQKAIVASMVGSIPQMLQDKVSAMLVPPGDVSTLSSTITTLLEQGEVCKTLGRNAKCTSEERFSADRMAERYATVYRELLSGSGKLGPCISVPIDT
jgi:glycosyltransferase involved in cell wall biosynthesis